MPLTRAYPRHCVAAREPLQALTYKTWVLKVSIHCEGCKKKVKKVLHGVEGVYDTNIDTKQQKVTVTGIVSAETLINKLVKSGKNAELWPEPIMEKEKKPGKSKKKEKQIEPPMKTPDQREAHKEIGKEKSAVQVEDIHQEVTKKLLVNSAQAPNESENSESAVKNGEVAETKAVSKKSETGSADNRTPGGEKKSIESEPSVGGGDSKKKKNKGRKSHVEAGSSTTSTPALIDFSLSVATNGSPPCHQEYQYLPHDYVPPVYAVSYNTALPSSSYTASYYASPPPFSYAYTHTGPEMRPPPSNIDTYTREPLDSFEMFSDENPNGCYIM